MKRNYEIAVISKGAFARTVRIHSPKRADRAVILHDGDMFFSGEHNIVATLKKLGIKNTAVIGIDGGATRLNDYLPFATEKSELNLPDCGGNADAHAEFIISALVPYLQKRFNYKSYALVGVSAGGAATLYTAAHAGDVFSAYGIICPPLFISPAAYDRFLCEAKFCDARYYVHTGGTPPEEFLQSVPPALFSACGVSVAATLINCGIKSVVLDTNKIDATGAPSAPAEQFIIQYSLLS